MDWIREWLETSPYGAALGVRDGRVYTGMTKRGVVFALGYPPSHATPSTDANQWRYWRNRWRTFIVHFEDGRVARVQH